ncbi:MAG: hypothetical protein QOF02_3171 [Blastocatellia bacterium]|jgi:hypothetical protein|nr:hypothetical protein [Blastocatellia bacterium]
MTKRSFPSRPAIAPVLKFVSILLFCALASATFISRLTTVSAVNATGHNAASSASAPPANHPPELAPVLFKRAGLGQRIVFGLGAIDEDSDDLRIEVTQKPASARFNQRTLTVDWTPQPTDDKRGQFVVRITEFAREGGERLGEVIKSFNIKVEPRPVETDFLDAAPIEVETLVSITDPQRLAAANARWPLVALFQRIAEIEAAKPANQGKNIQPANGETLFRDALKNLSRLHRNEEIDPDSPQFNSAWKAENWQLIAVRPRLNKKVFELRLVYFNVAAAEPVYLMPRMRIVRGKDAGRPEDQRQKNNQTFARLFHEAFFDGENLKPFVIGDKKAYGQALADYMTRVLTYKDASDPNMQATFAAMPHNARLGGDNKYDAKGNYLTGDGWALGVMKVNAVERDGKQMLAFNSPSIDGFATSIKPTPDNKAYKPVPAPRFDKQSKEFVAGWDALVDADDHGNIAIPDEHDDATVTAANIDSASFSRNFKLKHMVAETSLRDPRRRLFEERGMTCSQCHIRNFDEGDVLKNLRQPDSGVTVGATREIPRVFFVIIPSRQDGRNEYIRRSEEEQVGSLKGVFRDYLNINVNIHSSLANTWPFDTRFGRS